ncbi:hypothetical protein [Nonomuraea sp. JJY05]
MAVGRLVLVAWAVHISYIAVGVAWLVRVSGDGLGVVSDFT